jgi:hypothetical protein
MALVVAGQSGACAFLGAATFIDCTSGPRLKGNSMQTDQGSESRLVQAAVITVLEANETPNHHPTNTKDRTERVYRR